MIEAVLNLQSLYNEAYKSIFNKLRLEDNIFKAFLRLNMKSMVRSKYGWVNI